VGADHGSDIFRQDPLKLLDVFEDAGTRPVEVGAVFEDDEDVGIAEHGLSANRLYVGGGEKRGDDRVGDLIFDDVWWLAFPGNVDDYLNVGNIGERVERNMVQRPNSRKGQEESAGEDEG